MVHTMQASAVAEYLALTREEFDARSAAGEFDDIGHDGRWTVEAAETAYQRLYGQLVDCDPVAAARLITQVRRVAEIVRAYGDMPDPDDLNAGRGGIAFQVSLDLSIIAARLETMLRGTVFAAALPEGAALCAGDDAAEAELKAERHIEFAFDPVATIRPPVDVDDARRVAELRAACVMLADIRGGLLGAGDPGDGGGPAMSSVAGRVGAYMLSVQRDVILAHIDVLTSRTTYAPAGGAR